MGAGIPIDRSSRHRHSGGTAAAAAAAAETALVVEGVDGRSIAVQCFDRNRGQRSSRVPGRIIVAGEGDAKS